jgi:iron complex outermembrane receptor protein
MKKLRTGAVVLSLTLMSAAALAQSPGSAGVMLNIQPLPLGDALNEFARQTGLQVVLFADVGAGITTPGVSGNYTADDALAKLLAGTGLTYEYINERTIAVRATKKPGPTSMLTNEPVLRRISLAVPEQSPVVEDTAASEPERARSLEEVVVTAQRREQSLQDVPIAVSAFSGEDLNAFGVDDVQDLQVVTPGLVFNNTSALAQPYIRGVGTRLSLNGLESSVATYSDDRYVARPSAMMFDLIDVERVEVLKGPQGTLFGRNATGGAIRVITKDVSDELEGSIVGSVGNFSYYGLAGSVNAPISDTAGVRVTGMIRERDGYADNLSPLGVSELDDMSLAALRAKFRWEVTDRVTTRLTLGYWERDDMRGANVHDLSPPGLNVGIARGGVSGAERDEAATALNEKNRAEEFSAQLRLDVSFDAFDFVSVSTYSDLKAKVFTDGDGTSAAALDGGFHEEEEAYSQEFQLASSGSRNWEWLAGAFFYRSDGDIDFWFDAGAPFRLSTGLQSVETTAWAVFGQSTWHIDERWSLTLGGRYSSEKKEVKASPSELAPVTTTPTPFADDADWSEFTPQASIQYRLDHVMLYASYSRGFKSGGFNYPAATSQVLDPEILDMYELGFKGSFIDNRLRLNTSLYYYDYSDLQLTRAAGGIGLLTTENAANSKVLGLDMDLTWLATERMTLMAGISLLDSEYEDYPDANAKVFNAVLTGNPNQPGMSDAPFDANGHPLLRAPDWSAFLSLNYRIPIGQATLPAVLSYSYVDDYYFDFVAHPTTSALRQKSYGVLNGRVSYVSSDAKWEVTAWANNLTDKKYFNDIVAAAPGLRGSYAPPRTFGLDVTFNF